jgi:hypothetical protein
LWGSSITLLEPPEKRGEIEGILKRLVAGERITGVETVRLRKDGTHADVLLNISPIRGESGRIIAAWSIAHDLGRRRADEAALRRSEESYRHLFERHPAPMWLFDAKTLRFLEVNDAAVHLYGWSREEFLAMTIDEIRPPEDVPRLHEDLAEEISAPAVWRHRRKDGSLMDVEVRGRQVDFAGRSARLALLHDVTELRRLEDELRQTQKMDAIGRLAGGVAHDFNNLLVVIRGYSASLLKQLSGEQLESVRLIDTAAERASEFTRQLLTFSRQQVLTPEPLELNDVVTQTLALLGRTLREDIVVITDLAADAGAIVADRSELTKAILNLAINARDAMPDGGRLHVRTERVDFIEQLDERRIPPGSYVLLQITDSGLGMDEATRLRAFDPFYTTKPEGTGLGLASVYGLVKQSGGYIWLYSEPGAGTSFKLYFQASDATLRKATQEARPESVQGNGELILVAEDADMVRDLVTSTLTSHGYEVLAAARAEQALALAEQAENRIVLLLTDVVMPGMNGRELADQLLARNPDLKVLFTSGYPADLIVRDGIADESAAFIEKPFLPDQLVRKVRQILDH